MLVIPERHIETFRDIGELSADESKRMLEFVADTAKVAGIDEYRLLVYCGAGAGQTVFHLHWHVLGGRRGMPLRPPGRWLQARETSRARLSP